MDDLCLIATVRTLVGAMFSKDGNWALNTGKGLEREVADPQDKVGPFVCRNALAYPLHGPLFEMKAGGILNHGLNAHPT